MPTVKISDEHMAIIQRIAKARGTSLGAALSFALTTASSAPAEDEERLSADEKHALFEMMARDPRLAEGAQDGAEEEAIQREADRALDDEPAKESEGEAEAEERKRLEKAGRPNPLNRAPTAKDWARRGR